MLKTWKVDYFPAHNKYMLDLILNEKIYPIEISKEFAKELGDSALIDSFIEQAYINENKHLKAENAALRERLENAVELPCKVGDRFYIVEYYPPEIIEEECCDFSFREFPKILLENGCDCTYELGDNGSYFVTFDKNEAKKIFEKLKKEQRND